MRLPVQVEPDGAVPPDVDYRWDADTDILSARLRLPSDVPAAIGRPQLMADTSIGAADARPRDDVADDVSFGISANLPLSGAVELEGRDGSWIVLDVEAGHLAGVEVAVWPNVRRLTGLVPPLVVEDARIRVTGRKRRGPRRASEHEVTTHLTAEADPAERTIHFRLGRARESRSVRFGRDLLVDVDAQGHLAGLWLLNVPPVPRLT